MNFIFMVPKDRIKVVALFEDDLCTDVKIFFYIPHWGQKHRDQR